MSSAAFLSVLAFQVAAPLSPANTYLERYREVMALAPRADRVARVERLELVRDVARFTLTSGWIYQLTEVGGRTVGVVFEGSGAFSFTPPIALERERLALFRAPRRGALSFTHLVLLFADTTLAELERHLPLGPAADSDRWEVARAVNSPALIQAVRHSLDHLSHKESASFHPDMMAAFLNGDTSDLFYAFVWDGSKPLTFMINPFEFEEITLAKETSTSLTSRRPEVICRFSRGGAARPDTSTGERRNTAAIRDYRLDVNLAQTAMASLSFSAAARIDVTATSPVGPWIALDLYPKLRVDSVATSSGELLPMFRGKDADQIWIKLERRLTPADAQTLLVSYRGDLIDRYGDFFFIESSIAWYPRSLEGRAYATFDITYHTPSHYLIASVGEKKDSSVNDRVLTTRWVVNTPIRNASFNLGLFEAHQVREMDTPPVTVLASERAHREISIELRRQGIELPQQRKMKETVGADVLQSLRFFQHVYGAASVSQLHATEIPYYHGEAFPGLINLSWVTFQQTDTQGGHEAFRAHEVAHQWWGIGVDFATYRDQWLSEGLASFSGLWYLHGARKNSEKYFDMLRRWRLNIFDKRDEPSSISMGYRASTSKDEFGYQVLIYEKGAWVMHMLRVLMLELRTAKDDRFTAMMQDFYRTYRGSRASTLDFQRVVERHTGMEMGWFFEQWVHGNELPTYRVAHKTEAADSGEYRVTLRVIQENVPDTFRMYVPVTIDLDDGRQGRFRVNVQGSESTIPLSVPGRPKAVKFNALEGVLADVKTVSW